MFGFVNQMQPSSPKTISIELVHFLMFDGFFFSCVDTYIYRTKTYLKILGVLLVLLIMEKGILRYD